MTNAPRYTMAPAVVLRWTGSEYHPVIFNSERTHWIPASSNPQISGIRLPYWDMAQHFPGRSRCAHHGSGESWLATRYTDTRITNVGRHTPVPSKLEAALDEAFSRSLCTV